MCLMDDFIHSNRNYPEMFHLKSPLMAPSVTSSYKSTPKLS